MSTRERRLWAKKLTEAQEAVEAAEEGRADVMKAAYEAGMSFASIEASTGLGPHTVRNNIDDTGRAGESQ
jgi:alcohol dehydrogenase class IV